MSQNKINKSSRMESVFVEVNDGHRQEEEMEEVKSAHHVSERPNRRQTTTDRSANNQ